MKLSFKSPADLIKLAFFWSLARLALAAVALLIGGIPLALKLVGSSPVLYEIVDPLLTLAWLVSGAAAGYLLYAWFAGGKQIFGGTNTKDQVAFFVMIVSGFNLGWTGLSGTNIGISIAQNFMTTSLFWLTAALYMWTIYYLWHRYKQIVSLPVRLPTLKENKVEINLEYEHDSKE